MYPSIGDRAPSFSAPDAAGNTISLSSFQGKKVVVLYFYPKDNTSGCTKEACGFRDATAELLTLGLRVLGVSPDSVASHARFAEKYGLTFTLLSDPDRRLAEAYEVWVEKVRYGRRGMGIERSTFLVGADGRILRSWRGVKVDGHVEAVLAAAR